MSVFLRENRKNPLAAGGFNPRPAVVAPLCQILGAPLSEGAKTRVVSKKKNTFFFFNLNLMWRI